MNRFQRRILLSSIVTAIALGLLEAAWTHRNIGGPQNTWLGIFAILFALAVVSWPFLWRIPALAILEELTHIYTIGSTLDYRTVFNHWSVEYIHMNIYPYILFPIVTIICELCYHVLKNSRNSKK